MPAHCSFGPWYRPFARIRAVVIGSVLSALLPAGAMGMVEARRDLSAQVFSAPSAQGGLPRPASAMSLPVQLRIRTGDPPRSSRFGTEGMVQRDPVGAHAAGVTRQIRPVRPTVTILVPTDLATVPAGTLRVRGTVNAPGDAVGVRVNGVRAAVRSGAFTAAVRVTPHTLILSAVATMPSGLSACHQVGLAVRETPARVLQLRRFPDDAVVALPPRVSLLPATALPSAQADTDGEGAGDPAAAGLRRRHAILGDPTSRSASPAGGDSADAVETAPPRLVLTPVHPEERGSPVEPELAEMRRRVDLEGARRVLAMHPREHWGEPIAPDESGSLPRELSGTAWLSPRTRGEGDVEQNPRGKPLGATYSFGLLFIFDADGFRQIRWY